VRRLLLILAALAPAPLLGQAATEEPAPLFRPAPPGVVYGDAPQGFVEELIEEERPEWRGVQRPVAHLRGLDKIAGRVTDITAPVGQPVTYERLTITVRDCREPPEGQGADAFVWLEVVDSKGGAAPVFSGWIFASSPALSAMDHQRYDLWALSCATS
jgi:hypothetical protein